MSEEVRTTFTPSPGMDAAIGSAITPRAQTWGARAKDEARSLVPVVTGATRDSIGYEVVVVNGLPVTRVFATSRGAYFVETGEGHGPPQPFLRPAANRVASNP